MKLERGLVGDFGHFVTSFGPLTNPLLILDPAGLTRFKVGPFEPFEGLYKSEQSKLGFLPLLEKKKVAAASALHSQ